LEGVLYLPDVRSSLFQSFIDKYAVLLITIVSTMILARRLTPTETGVYTVAWSLINIAQALRDFGIFSYIVQEKELTRERLATAFTISLSLGVFLTSAFAASADSIAHFYGDPRMRVLVLILSFNFLLVSFASVGTALLQRAMSFHVMMRINIASALVNAVTSVGLVYAGLGPVALAWSSLCGIIVVALCNLLYLGRQIYLRPTFAAWRRIAEFGILSSGAALLSVMSSRVPELTIGRLLGLEAAGLFSRGCGLITLFQQAFTNALMPVTSAELSRRHRDNQNIGSAVLDGISYLTGVGWPFLAILGLMAHPVIVIFYGEQWIRAIPIAQILCLAAAAGIMSNLAIVLFNAIGAVRQNFVVQGVTLPIYVIAVVLGCLIDLRVAAFCVVIASVGSTYWALVALNRKLGTSWRDILRAVTRSAVVTAATAIVPAIMLLNWGFSDGKLWPVTIMSVAGGVVFWVGALAAVDHPLWKQLVTTFDMLWAKMANAAES
jgi:O-antigen/teichoic acid export membrane protein